MEEKTFKNKITTLASQRNVLAFCVLALSVAVIKLCFTVQSKEERVVVVPTMGPSFWLEKSRVSKDYLSTMGIFLSDLLLTRTPSDVRWKNEQILGHAHPRFYSQLKRALSEEKETIRASQSTFLFEASHLYPIEKDLQFIIEGVQKTYIEKTGKGKPLVHAQKLKYILSFRCEEGRLYLTSISQEKL